MEHREPFATIEVYPEEDDGVRLECDEPEITVEADHMVEGLRLLADEVRQHAQGAVSALEAAINMHKSNGS